MNLNVSGDFQICISVPLISLKIFEFQIKSNWFDMKREILNLDRRQKMRFFYISEILYENYYSYSMLKIFPKYFNFENISKKCIRVLGP